jgi:hypothetical protein
LPPTWLTVLAWTSLNLAFAAAAMILWGTYARGRRHEMLF